MTCLKLGQGEPAFLDSQSSAPAQCHAACLHPICFGHHILKEQAPCQLHLGMGG